MSDSADLTNSPSISTGEIIGVSRIRGLITMTCQIVSLVAGF